jgi:hypothetical protein
VERRERKLRERERRTVRAVAGSRKRVFEGTRWHAVKELGLRGLAMVVAMSCRHVNETQLHETGRQSLTRDTYVLFATDGVFAQSPQLIYLLRQARGCRAGKLTEESWRERTRVTSLFYSPRALPSILHCARLVRILRVWAIAQMQRTETAWF